MTRPANPELPGEILDTAERIVAAEGHSALHMRRLAEAARVTPTTLYYYFKSKDRILTLLRLRTAKRLNGRLQRMDLSDPRSALVAIADAHIAFAEENPKLYQLLVERLPDPSVLDPDEHRTLHFSYFAAERALDALATRESRDVNTREKAMTGWIMLHGFVSLLTSGALENVLGLERDELKAKFLEIYAGGVGRENKQGESSKRR